ncbi:MAG TPA: hypothetical protein ENJ50_05820 [Planctomycetaceae bacterium]|nr:hypothetical protein [Planctomycetaceae bacterium]
MVATYDRNGVQFCYPENWRTTDEVWSQSPPTVAVQSPGTGFWSVTVYPESTGPRRIAAEALQAMRHEYADLEFEVLEDETWLGEDCFGYDMRFFYLDWVIRVKVLGFRAAGHTFLTQWQAEDREFDQTEEVFRAISLSLAKATPAATKKA